MRASGPVIATQVWLITGNRDKLTAYTKEQAAACGARLRRPSRPRPWPPLATLDYPWPPLAAATCVALLRNSTTPSEKITSTSRPFGLLLLAGGIGAILSAKDGGGTEEAAESA